MPYLPFLPLVMFGEWPATFQSCENQSIEKNSFDLELILLRSHTGDGILTETTTIGPLDDLQTYSDREATTHYFQSRDVIEPGTIQSCSQWTFLLPDNTSVTASRSGKVIMPLKEIKTRLETVLPRPTLGVSLVCTEAWLATELNHVFADLIFFLNLKQLER